MAQPGLLCHLCFLRPSFFGLFEITFPRGIANKAGSKSGLGNLYGIFFMAATLTIVSFLQNRANTRNIAGRSNYRKVPPMPLTAGGWFCLH